MGFGPDMSPGFGDREGKTWYVTRIVEQHCADPPTQAERTYEVHFDIHECLLKLGIRMNDLHSVLYLGIHAHKTKNPCFSLYNIHLLH